MLQENYKSRSAVNYAIKHDCGAQFLLKRGGVSDKALMNHAGAFASNASLRVTTT